MLFRLSFVCLLFFSMVAQAGEVQSRRMLFFTASWCGPCQTTKHNLKEVFSEMQVGDTANCQIQLIHLDREHPDYQKNQRLVEFYGVKSIPTFVFLEAGKSKNTWVMTEYRRHQNNRIEKRGLSQMSDAEFRTLWKNAYGNASE